MCEIEKNVSIGDIKDTYKILTNDIKLYYRLI